MRKPARAVGAAVLFVACTGLDPGKFRPDTSSTAKPSVAGYAFDAGPGPDVGGSAGSRTASRAGSGGRPSAGAAAEPEGGAAGDDEGGAGGTAPDAGRGGALAGNGGHGGAGRGGRGGSGGLGGTRAGGGGLAGSVTTGGGTAGAGAGQGGSSATHALFFSEYVEGSSSFKALELTAREDSTLAGCRLATYFNGASTASGIALDGALAAGSVYVLCSSGLSTLLGAVCHRTTNLTFNGDDAVALECDGATLDVIGQIGVDPGDAWGSGEASTLNHSLRRSCSASAGDSIGSDPFDPSREWLALPTDSFDGLGSAVCSGD